MQARTALTVLVARPLLWLLTPAALVASLVVENRTDAANGRPSGNGVLDASQAAANASFLVAILACWFVGAVLTLRVPRNAVGWLFLALAAAIAVSGTIDDYTTYALDTPPGTRPLGAVSATVGQSTFAWWFLLIALCLQLTPTGHPISRRWSRLMWGTLAVAVVYQAGALLRSTPLDAPHQALASPLAMAGLGRLPEVVAFVSVVALGLALLASVYLIVVRFRLSVGDERRQMLWLLVGATPLPLCVVVAFLASFAKQDWLAGWAVVLGIVCMAVGAGFSIVKYRLYGVEEVVSRAVAYVLASLSVIVAYASVVLVITHSSPGVGSGSTPATVLATLAAAAVALPAYRWARGAVDRRFNRRRYDAVRTIRAGLAETSPDLAGLIVVALGDPTARILFPAEAGRWVTADGRIAEAGDNAVEVMRADAVAARVEFDSLRCHRDVVAAVAREAAAEIDNVGLRAELARQLQEIGESRARLAGAHLAERRRMERDLHDGAQQRLLAIALQLQSARVNGSTAALHEQAERAIQQLGLAVQELRQLANGMQPASLAGGGLRAAVEDLAARIPMQLTFDVVDRRFAPNVEGAAWFVIAEAVSNAVKYAETDEVHVRSTLEPLGLRIVVTDQGRGGADAEGAGLQGLSDRVAALGGNLVVRGHVPNGTRVEAILPCA
jgi:signal transduction histidine kinase